MGEKEFNKYKLMRWGWRECKGREMEGMLIYFFWLMSRQKTTLIILMNEKKIDDS